jgi:hypothetical protein
MRRDRMAVGDDSHSASQDEGEAMSEGIRQVQAIGESMARIVEARDLDDREFAKAAEQLLIDSGGVDEVDLIDVTGFLAGRSIVEQTDWRFSDLPVIVYRHPRFYIELLHWVHATTVIHEHGFAGAFMVVSGSSLHSRYEIGNRHTVAEQVTLCHARLVGAERLLRGAVRRIDPGVDGLVHSLFHLDTPSVSLVLRTYGHSSDQYSLVRPRLWWNQLRTMNDRVLKSIERASLVAEKIERGSGRRLLESIAGQVTDAEWVSLVLRWVDFVASREEFADLLSIRRSTADGIDAALLDGYDYLKAERLLTAARESIHDPELRFLFALLLNVPDRGDLLRLVAERTCSADPVAVVAGWLARLAWYRGDPRERLARLAAAASVDHRIGVLIRESLPQGAAPGASASMLAAALDPGRSDMANAEDLARIRSTLASQPALRVLFDGGESQ